MTASILLVVVLVLLLGLGLAQTKPGYPHADDNDEPDSWGPDPSWIDEPVAWPAYHVKSYECEQQKEVTITTIGGHTFHMRIVPDSDDIQPCEYGITQEMPPNSPHLTDLTLAEINIPLGRDEGSIVLDTASGRIILTPWCQAKAEYATCTTTVSWTFTNYR